MLEFLSSVPGDICSNEYGYNTFDDDRTGPECSAIRTSQRFNRPNDDLGRFRGTHRVAGNVYLQALPLCAPRKAGTDTVGDGLR